MQETWVWSLGQEDALEEEMANHSSILPWRITWTEEPGMQQSMESQRIRHDLATQSVQSLSCVWIFVTPWTAARQASMSFTNYWALLKLMSTESVMPSNYLILCHPLLLLPSVLPNIRVFSNESVLHIRWPKNWSISYSKSPSNEYWGLISFRIDWFDLLAVQGTLRVFSKATVQKHQFFGTHLSLSLTLTSIHDYWENHSFD